MNPYRDLADEDLLAQCRVETRRASGPGGQHRNKVESSIRLLHGPTGLTAIASENRSQHRNREVALERLREKLAHHFHRDPKRVPTRKTRAAKERQLGAKHRVGEKKKLRRAPTVE